MRVADLTVAELLTLIRDVLREELKHETLNEPNESRSQAGLLTLEPLHALDYHPRTFVRSLIAVAPQHRDVQQHVRPTIVGYDETVALRGIEPFDDPGDFDKIGCGIA